METNSFQPRPFTQWWTTHPLEASLISTAAGILFTVIFFLLTQKDRDVRFAVSPSPTTIVKAGQSSDLRVSFKEKEVDSDLSSVQIALWNNGKESIKRENILSGTVTITFQPKTRILEARVKQLTRDLVDFKLDTSDSSSGVLHCSWNVLEHEDGALLEVIYTGTSVRVGVDGAIEGRVPIRSVMLGNQPGYVSGVPAFTLAGFSIIVGIRAAIKRYRAVKTKFGQIGARVSAGATGMLWAMQTFLAFNTAFWIFLLIARPSVPFSF
jgi:hypothetical protein